MRRGIVAAGALFLTVGWLASALQQLSINT
jgi:hypothetical protein